MSDGGRSTIEQIRTEEPERYERILCVMIRRPPFPGEHPFQRGFARQLAGLKLLCWLDSAAPERP